MKSLSIILILSYFNVFAHTNEHFICETDYVGKVSINLQHSRITNARVSALGKTFYGHGTFTENIMVNDEYANHGESNMIHIPLNSPDGFPSVMYVYYSGGRAPTTYEISCKKLGNRSISPEPQINCDYPRNSCY